MIFVYHNGACVPEDCAVFSAHDRARLGQCVFNTMLVMDGRIVNAKAHCAKILHDAGVLMGDEIARKIGAADKLIGAAGELLEKNGFNKGRYAVNVIVTAGMAGNGVRDVEGAKPEVVIRALPAPENFPPVHAVIAQGVRRNEGSPLSRIKCANYGENIFAMREAVLKGANEAILLNNRGDAVCGTTSNLFVITGGELITPPLSDGAQNGVVRGIMIKKYGAIEKSVSGDDLVKAEGVYLTNSVRGVAIVEKLDGKDMPLPSLKIDKDLHL